MTSQEFINSIKAETEASIRRMEILESCGNELLLSDIESSQAKVYEREQVMDALTGDDNG